MRSGRKETKKISERIIEHPDAGNQNMRCRCGEFLHMKLEREFTGEFVGVYKPVRQAIVTGPLKCDRCNRAVGRVGWIMIDRETNFMKEIEGLENSLMKNLAEVWKSGEEIPGNEGDGENE